MSQKIYTDLDINGNVKSNSYKFNLPSSVSSQPNMLIPKTDGTRPIWYDNSSVANDLAFKSDVDNLQIGGRNFIVLSKLNSYINYNTKPISELNKITTVFTKKNTDGTDIVEQNTAWTLNIIGYTPEASTYTISGRVTINNAIPSKAKWGTGLASTYGSLLSNNYYDESSGRFVITQSYSGSSVWIFHRYSILSTGDVIAFYDLKFEKGNKATDWTPAPEDKQDRLQDITGNIGVGKTDASATEKLDINGNVKATSFIKSGGTSSQYLMADGSVSTLTNPITGTGTTNYIPKFTASGTIGNSLIYDNGTNIGIGTNAPNSTDRIHVFSSTSKSSIRLQSTHSTSSAEINFQSAGGSGKFELDYAGNMVFRTSQSGLFFDNFSTTGSIYFRTGGSNERMRIDNNGNIGIGTTSPNRLLHVNGIARAITFTADRFAQDGLQGASYFAPGTTSTLSSQNNLTIQTVNSNTDILITPTRNVGIGTTSPSEKLEVNGNVKATSFIKSGGTSTQFLMADGSVNSNTYVKTDGTGATGTWGINITGNAGSVGGYPASSLWRNDGGVWNPSANITLNQTANNQEWSFDITRNGFTGGYWQVWDSSLGTMFKVDATSGKVSAPYNFVGTLEGSLIGNAATAATLQTARTLTIGNTGKTFDGSANVAWSLSEIGAQPAGSYAASSHTHDDRYYTEGEVNSLLSGKADVSHNHTSLTGVTSIGFAAQSSDSASISTTIDGTSTFFDFNLTDDNNNDWWRWRFTPSGSTVYDAMTLKPLSNGNADLTISGNVFADNLAISNWNTAYGWGNHASAGYLTSYTETDTLASITGRGATTSTLSTFDGGLNIGNAKLRWGGTTSPTLGFPFTGGPNGFWIDVNDGDTGGLAIDNDGTTIYGAGDSGHVFRVIDEDVYQATSNVDASTTFRIQQGQNGGGYLRGNFEITGTLTASGYNKTNWDTAFGWGNHASAGYATQSWVQSQGYLTSVSDVWVNTSGDTMTGALTIQGGWASTILDGDNVVLRKPNYSSGGWARTLLNFQEYTGTSLFQIGGYGNNNTMTYGYLGSAYNNPTFRWYADKTVVFDGLVGIGTTSPSEKLDVNGNIKASSFIKSGGTSTQFLMADGSVKNTTTYVNTIGGNRVLSNWYITSPYEGGKFSFIGDDYPALSWGQSSAYMSDESLFYLDNAGISQTSTNYSNYFSGEVNINNYLNVTSPFTLDSTFLFRSNGQKTVSATVGTFGTKTGGVNDFQLIFSRSASGTGAYYSIQSVEQDIAYRAIILQPSGGNVGIGTTSPSTKLDVNGWATFLGSSGNRLKIWDGTDNIPTISADNLLALQSPTIQFYATDVTDSNNNSIYLKLKTITGNTTIDNSYHNKIVRITASCTITIQAGLRTDFNCTFEVIGAYTAQFVDGSGATTSAPFGRYLKTDLTAMFYCTGTASNYRLNGSLTTS